VAYAVYSMFDTIRKWKQNLAHDIDVRKNAQTRLEQAGYMGGSSTLGESDPAPISDSINVQIGHLQKLQPLRSAQIFSSVPNVNRVVKKKAGMLATPELKLFRTDTRTNENVEVTAINSKLGSLLQSPNSYTTITDLLEQFILWYQITGCGYIALDFDQATGKPNLIVLESIYVWVIPGKDTKTSYYKYNVKGNVKYFEDWQVCVIQQFNPLDFYFGMTSMGAGLSTINTESYKNAWLEAQMQRGNMPGGVIKNPNNIDPAEYERMRSEWAKRRPNSSRTLILPEGLDYDPFNEPGMAEFLKAVSNETLDTIAGIYEMHPALFHQLGSSLTQGVLTEAETHTWNTCLLKESRKIAEILTLKLARPICGNNYFFRYDYSSIPALATNDLNKTKVAVAHMNMGSKTINEDRIERGMPPYTGENAEFGNTPLPLWQHRQAMLAAQSRVSGDSTSQTSPALPMPGNEGGRRDQSQEGEPEMIDQTGKRSFKSYDKIEFEIEEALEALFS